MKLSIIGKTEKDIFISLFQLLKNSSTTISIIFTEDYAHIQGMDKSHICLFNIKLNADWFSTYNFTTGEMANIFIDSQILYNVLSMNQDMHSIIMHYEGDPDNISIDLVNESPTAKSSGDMFNKYFKIPLADLDQDLLDIPETEYDVDFSISAKKIQDVFSQLLIFGETLNIKCNEDRIDLNTTGVCGEMLVNIPIDEIVEFSISEDENIDISFNLKFVHKMCITNKLSTDIEFSIRKDYPMKIKYNLGKDNFANFFIAPQITED